MRARAASTGRGSIATSGPVERSTRGPRPSVTRRPDRTSRAAHYLCIASLAASARRGEVTLHPAKTTGDYARELRRRGAPSERAFQAFRARYDRVVYDLQHCSAEEYARLIEAARPLLARERGRMTVPTSATPASPPRLPSNPTPWWTKPAIVLPAVGALAFVAALFSPVKQSPRGGDPRLSSLSTAPLGASLAYELADRLGWDVERRLRTGIMSDRGTILAVLDPAIPLRVGEVHALPRACARGRRRLRRRRRLDRRPHGLAAPRGGHRGRDGAGRGRRAGAARSPPRRSGSTRSGSGRRRRCGRSAGPPRPRRSRAYS
jgi:hypothetical protein